MLKYVNLGHYYQAFPLSIIAVDVLNRLSLDNRFHTPIFFSIINRQSWYFIAFWTIATIILNQQSIISNIARGTFKHKSIISITAIDIFDHQSINSTITIDFLITSRELMPLLTDMASYTRLDFQLFWEPAFHKQPDSWKSSLLPYVLRKNYTWATVATTDLTDLMST